MRILALSDSHQKKHLLKTVLTRESAADIIIHLGDGAADMKPLTNENKGTFYLLQGNCDSRFAELTEYVDTIAGNTHIFAAHGDRFQVKFGLEKIGLQAQLRNADLVLFGHTHIPFYRYENGIHYFNPGALVDSRYGCIDVTEKGIYCIHKEIK